ncbi:MAG TPA: hypothetical protein VNL74_03060 [Methylococcus sp.]|nr:hypothetical protein [Methylococcus sp.]
MTEEQSQFHHPNDPPWIRIATGAMNEVAPLIPNVRIHHHSAEGMP